MFMCVLALTADPSRFSRACPQCYTVLLDGAVIGYMGLAAAPRLVQKLRHMKCHGEVRRDCGERTCRGMSCGIT